MAGNCEIFVLRHGQTLWNAEGRHQGRRDSPLTAHGRAQAADQGRILLRELADPASVACFSSPQGRARATAEIALAAIGRTARPDDRLKEVSFGLWEGLTREQIDRDWPDQGAAEDPFHWHFTSPQGERLDDLMTRARSFLDDLDGPTVIITHGILSRVLCGLYLGLDSAGMAAIEGGQGVVYHLKAGRQRRLTWPGETSLAVARTKPHG